MSASIRILNLTIQGSSLRSGLHTLGSSLIVLAFINENTVDEAKITIEDPFDALKVNNVTMDKLANGIYCYTYQSTPTDIDGVYDVIVKMTKNSVTAIAQTRFRMEEQGLLP